jgi:Na+/proline symporter
MLAGKIATVAVGVIVIGLTFVMQYAQGAKDLFSLSNQVFSVFLAPITLPMIAGVLIRPISKRAGLTALVGGIALGLALFFLAPWLSAHFKGIPDLRGEVPMTWFTSIVTVVLLLIGTKLFPDRAEEKPALDEFFAEIERPSIN